MQSDERRLSKARIIEDLDAIKSYFMAQTGGCYPLCLDEAIMIIYAECDDEIVIAEDE